jgi:hypothetical protein
LNIFLFIDHEKNLSPVLRIVGKIRKTSDRFLMVPNIKQNKKALLECLNCLIFIVENVGNKQETKTRKALFILMKAARAYLVW